MISAEVERTLVKSLPELWAELGDPAALARHLGELGEVRITKAEPEKSVEWEAEAASGKVELQQSGWGTKVTLSVTREAGGAEAEPVPEPEPEPVPVPEPEPVPVPEPEPRLGFFARLFRRRGKSAPEPPSAQEPSAEEIAAEQAAAEQTAAEEAAAKVAAEEAIVAQTTELLTAVLDRLGAAHHRPFSRA